jgi:hypothetical protein
MQRVGAMELGYRERRVRCKLVCSRRFRQDLTFGLGAGSRGFRAESFSLDEAGWDRGWCLRRRSSGARGLGAWFNVSWGDFVVELKLAGSSVGL